KLTTGNQNTAVGISSLGWNASAATTGSYNAAFGQGALTALTSGSSNVAVGSGSLQANTTASNNTAVGYQAGYSNTTSSYTTFIGQGAGYANTTGGNALAVGALSLYANTTGTDNSAIGTEALRANTTGGNNTALGRQALYSNTTASNNTAVGYQAGYDNTTGAGGVAFGYQAALANTTGNYNIFIGAFAGQGAGSSITGGNNTVIGTSAGASLTTGTYNTFVGAAGQVNQGSGGLVTTGSKNTILGPYNGNQGGLDIRTASKYIVLSDGDGNPILSTCYGRSLAISETCQPQPGFGITFPATQNPSSNANTLDDYERGSWTPTFTNLTIGNGSVWGTYVKIGRQVTVNFGFNFGSTSSFSGGITSITGLPFATETTGQHVAVASFLKQGSGWYTGSVTGQNTSLQHLSVSGGNSVVGATNPFTWAANDYAAITLTYITPA
ncbi:MAG: hypothetical protein EBR82_65710, partial [Caulobacteraceae bacterium]|nr:hypothetical protein [Caulobacteraceae bacterium]